MAEGETSGAGPGVVVRHVTVGIVAAPDLPDGLAADCARDLRRELGARHPEVHWHLQLVHDALVAPPADDGEIVAAARRRLLDGDWDLVIVLTDLPLGGALRPVVAHASPVHGVAVLSVPALGTVALRHRARDALLRLVGVLLGEARDAGPGARAARARSARMTRRLRGLGYYGLLALVTVMALGPTLWVVVSSFKTSGQIFTSSELIRLSAFCKVWRASAVTDSLVGLRHESRSMRKPLGMYRMSFRVQTSEEYLA